MEAALYFYLEPYVYYSVAPNGTILINLLDDTLLYFSDADSIRIIKAIQESENRVARIGKGDLGIPLVRQTILNFMGDIVKTDKVPLQFDSEINNLSGKEAYRKSIKFTRHGIGTLFSDCFIFSNFNDIVSARLLTLLCGIDRNFGNDFVNVVMSPSRIKVVIDRISEVNPSTKFFISGLNETTLKCLLQIVPNSINIIPIYSFETFLENPIIRQCIEENHLYYKLIIHSSIPLEKLTSNKNKPTLMLAIKDETDLEYYESLQGKGYKVEIYPVLTKDNSSFILSLLDWSLDDLKKLKDKYRTIKQNNLINSNTWGRIFVNPKGAIAFSPLDINNGASICGDFFEFFHQTLIKGDFAWARTRNYSQCRKCCFQRLCPSPTPIEDKLRENGIWKCSLNNNQN